ncbi:MAG: SAP domain-containing protein [Anaerolineae bacterium]|jgi:hypothetical protein|nr:SAP domain-containing protein [Anaerolineae bacterium]
MTQPRPNLNRDLTSATFRSYYWLKEELVAFCREHDLSTSGSKIEITDRIAYFLQNGVAPTQSIAHSTKKQNPKVEGQLSMSEFIREGYRSDEEHRAFFKSVIGDEFKFTVGFMQFCKDNIGKKTYADAVAWWLDEQKRKRDPNYKPDIAPQFEYNRFIHAYFEVNPDGKLEEAIRLWKEVKSKPGDNIYRPEQKDTE